jgi:hypothetical protein
MSARVWTCADFEAGLSDYREGALANEAAAARLHLGECAACSGLLDAVALATTALRELPAAEPSPAWCAAARAHAACDAHAAMRIGWFTALGRRLRAPRFALSFAMSVFAVSLVLNAADVNLNQFSWRDLTPAGLASGMQRDLDRLRARGLAYVEDLRVVYEIEAAVHQMRQSPPPPPAGHDHSQRLPPASADALATL